MMMAHSTMPVLSGGHYSHAAHHSYGTMVCHTSVMLAALLVYLVVVLCDCSVTCSTSMYHSELVQLIG